MSQENVEVVRQAFDAVGRGDIDGVLRVCDEEIVITQPSELPDASSLRQYGHDGVLEAFAIWPEQWDDYRVGDVRVLADSADDVIVAISMELLRVAVTVSTTRSTVLVRVQVCIEVV